MRYWEVKDEVLEVLFFAGAKKAPAKAPEKLRQTQSNDYVNKISGLDTPFKEENIKKG